MPDRPAGAVYRGLLLPRRVIRFASQIALILIAATLILIAGYRLTQLWLVPDVSIGLAQTAPEEINTLLSTLARITRPSSLKIRIASNYSSLDAVSAGLEEGEFDFAVIRPDQTLPRNGLTAAILREDPIVVLAFSEPKVSARGETRQKKPDSPEKEEAASQFKKKRIGLISFSAADRAALTRALAFHDVSEDALVPLDVASADIRSRVVEAQVDAIAVIGPPAWLRRLIATLSDLKPTILSTNALGLAMENPVFGQTTIAARSLTEGVPVEDVQVTSVSWRLVARKDVERATVSEFLQALFAHRLDLARATPLAWQIKGLEDDGATFAKLPIHRGALDYYNREQQTFMDLYGDWLWLGLFAAGGVSSGLAWLGQLLSRRRKQLVENILDRLLEILSEARDANSVKRLDELTVEVDGLVTHAVRQARWRATDPTSSTALTLAIDSSRAAIADRRAFFIRQPTPAMRQ